MERHMMIYILVDLFHHTPLNSKVFWPITFSRDIIVMSPEIFHFVIQLEYFFLSVWILQVRKKLVKSWLPVLIACKDNVSPLSPNIKIMYLELEETFLRIISTLPMSDSQELLQQCLSFSTRNAEDCPHLVNAFNTWFRRAEIDKLD